MIVAYLCTRDREEESLYRQVLKPKSLSVLEVSRHWSCNMLIDSTNSRETMTVEGMIKIVYDLLKDKLPISKLTFKSGVNLASQEYCPEKHFERCPWCGVKLDETGKCYKCGYQKKLII